MYTDGLAHTVELATPGPARTLSATVVRQPRRAASKALPNEGRGGEGRALYVGWEVVPTSCTRLNACVRRRPRQYTKLDPKRSRPARVSHVPGSHCAVGTWEAAVRSRRGAQLQTGGTLRLNWDGGVRPSRGARHKR